jgi:hypothetical protein
MVVDVEVGEQYILQVAPRYKLMLLKEIRWKRYGRCEPGVGASPEKDELQQLHWWLGLSMKWDRDGRVGV